MTLIINYLKSTTLLDDNTIEAQKFKHRASHYVIIDDVLYKRSYTMSYLICISLEEAIYVMLGVHEGVCGNHTA